VPEIGSTQLEAFSHEQHLLVQVMWQL